MAPCFFGLFASFLAGEIYKSMGNDNAAQSTLYLERALCKAHTWHAQCYCNMLIGPLDGIFTSLAYSRPTTCVLALRVFGVSAVLHLP